MRAIYSLLCCISLLTLSHASEAATISIKEYPDRFVVEIDGSMDPKAVVNAETNSPPASTHLQQPAISRNPQQKPATEARTATANTSTVSEPAPPTSLSTASPSTSASVSLPEGEGKEPTQYNRGQQAMEYLAKLPNRRDYVEGRLEARQTRWTKKQAPSDPGTQ